MNKPIVLLVDDDPTVLEALEAELTPAFGEIARFEAFVDPNEVLAEIPRWSSEERPIAVAILDQKMPAMTGLELLSRLREGLHTAGAGSDDEFDPVGSMRAILLTGYAGLESAVESKNVAGADRYLEKPWSVDTLREQVRTLLKDHLASAGADRHFVLRQVTTPDELRSLFRLRYEVFRQSGLGALCHPEANGIDIDAYDLRAHHLGLFLYHSDASRPVGNLRVVVSPGAVSDAVRQVAAAFPGLSAKLERDPEVPFPIMTYFPDVDSIRNLWKQCVERDEPLAEPGRLALAPEARTRGLARQLIGSTVAFHFLQGLDNAVVACDALHKGVYSRCGFHRLEGTQDHNLLPGHGSSCCLVGSRNRIRSPTKERVETLANRLRGKGHTCFCATFPRCLHEPYATGNFGGIDLFCPHVAGEILGTFR